MIMINDLMDLLERRQEQIFKRQVWQIQVFKRRSIL